MTQQMKSPARFEERATRVEYQTERTPFRSPRRFPPYARHLDDSSGSIAILTGSGAWERKRAASGTWFAHRKLILPLADDPAAYRWPVSGRDCIVFSFGTPEPRARLITLSVALVKAGAKFVIWNIPGDMPATFFAGGAHHEGK